MTCTAALSKKDIDDLLELLEIESTHTANDEVYYSIWDFGKEPDETHGTVAVSAELSSLIEPAKSSE